MPPAAVDDDGVAKAERAPVAGPEAEPVRAPQSPTVTIYTKAYCDYCFEAKRLLTAKGIAFCEIDVTHDRERWTEMVDRSRRFTVPQVFIGDQPVGGYDDLSALNRDGGLDRLLGRLPR